MKLKMEFNFNGRKVSLREIQSLDVIVIASGRMDKLLAKLAELCMISMGLFVQEKHTIEASLCAMGGEVVEDMDNQELQGILEKYNDLF